MLVAGGFCYGRLLDDMRIVGESQNSPAPVRASDRLLSIGRFRVSQAFAWAGFSGGIGFSEESAVDRTKLNVGIGVGEQPL